MTNKRINLNTDFLNEDYDGGTLKKQEEPKNTKPFKYLGDKKGVYYEDDGYDEGRNWQKYSRDTSNNNSSNKDTKKTYGFKHVFWGLVILVVVIALFGGFDDKPNSTMTITSNSSRNSNEDDVITGQFSCSSYNHDEAGRLSPSTFDKVEIDKQLAEVNSMDTGIDKIEAEIDSFRVNKSSQSSINTYNKKIDTYNSLVNKRKTKYTEYKNLLDSYNVSVDKYNSFLEKNCTRRY